MCPLLASSDKPRTLVLDTEAIVPRRTEWDAAPPAPLAIDPFVAVPCTKRYARYWATSPLGR
jgi:hypothetical protein